MFEDVEFVSGDVLLRGRLYRDTEAPGLLPAVVMAHGFSATITMVADKYAEVFAAAGFVVLLYDHAGFGRSDGEPRQVINPWDQARGYRDALSYVETVDGVDVSRLALWGDSLSGGEAIIVTAVDDRVAAVVAQVPVCGARTPPDDPDGLLFAHVRETLMGGDGRGTTGTGVGPLPIVSTDQVGTPSLLKPLTAFRWFIEYGGRHQSGWQNVGTLVTPDTPAPFQAGLASPHLRVPSLWVISPTDEMPAADPAVARLAYSNAGGEKELLEIDGGHFGLIYWPSASSEVSATTQRGFLKRVLG